jgi:hypothetical protein
MTLALAPRCAIGNSTSVAHRSICTLATSSFAARRQEAAHDDAFEITAVRAGPDRAATSVVSGSPYTDTASTVTSRCGSRRTIAAAIVEVRHSRKEDNENSR